MQTFTVAVFLAWLYKEYKDSPFSGKVRVMETVAVPDSPVRQLWDKIMSVMEYNNYGAYNAYQPYSSYSSYSSQPNHFNLKVGLYSNPIIFLHRCCLYDLWLCCAVCCSMLVLIPLFDGSARNNFKKLLNFLWGASEAYQKFGSNN